MVRQLEQNVI